MHNFLLALADDFELSKLFFNKEDDWVLALVGIGGLRDHGSDFSASFRQKLQCFCITLILLFYLSVGALSHIQFLLMLKDLLFVRLVDSS